MWSLCPECNIEGGCDCYIGTGKRHSIIDHEKEQKRHLDDLEHELTPSYKPNKTAINNYFEKRRKDENDI